MHNRVISLKYIKCHLIWFLSITPDSTHTRSISMRTWIMWTNEVENSLKWFWQLTKSVSLETEVQPYGALSSTEQIGTKINFYNFASIKFRTMESFIYIKNNLFWWISSNLKRKFEMFVMSMGIHLVFLGVELNVCVCNEHVSGVTNIFN